VTRAPVDPTQTDGGPPSARLAAGEEAGAPPDSLVGRALALRRRIAARIRGEHDLAELVAHGLQLGPEVYIARGFYLDLGFAWLISIGAQSTLGPNVTILAHDAAPKLRTGYSAIARVHIGARVFVGANVTILPGSTIGDDAIVGAGSVVRGDIEAATVVIGNPAVPVGSTDRHTARHLAALRARPRYRNLGRRGLRDVSRVERDKMLAELNDGPGYVD
jgi:acetyltransferase-like isoleucine patch superfamily enzyme